MKFKNKENEKIVLPDGRTIWLSRAVAVVGTVCLIKDGMPYFLISKRGKGSADFQGLYNLTCGYLDNDESSSEAFVRELWEECGVNIYNIINNKENLIINNYLENVWDVKSTPNENRQNVSLHHGIIAVVNELPIPQILNEVEEDEVEEVLWVSMNDIYKFKFAFNHLERIEKFISMHNILKNI